MKVIVCGNTWQKLHSTLQYKYHKEYDKSDNMPVDSLLAKLGFSKNESKTYLALFELGKARAGEIIKHTGLHRNLVYQSLKQLVEKRLVAKVLVRGVAAFEALSSQALVEGFDRTRALAEEVAEELKKRQEKSARDIQIYEGAEGVKQAVDKSLEGKDPVYVLGGSKLTSMPELQAYWRAYHRKRVSNGTRFKIFYDRSTEKEIVERENQRTYTEAKYLPFGTESPSWFTVHGDALAIGIPGQDPLTFSIKSKAAAESMKQYFEYLWNQPIRIERGEQALHDAFYGMADALDPGEEYYVFGATPGQSGKERGEFFDAYHAHRIRRGVVANLLTYKELVEPFRARMRTHGDPELKISHTRAFTITPPRHMQINLYKEHTVMILTGEPIVFHFDQPEVYHGFKHYFDELWRQAV